MATTVQIELEDLSPHTFVQFGVRKVARARVVWLNHRYFLERGVNSLIPAVEKEHCRWLANRYGVMVPNGANDTLLTGPTKSFLADRYGGAGVSQHGGSGRAGISGLYNAKGIGRTPLASPDADWGHAHGYLPLREAVREAIAAEIAIAELPHGAVPIVAVIDTGCSMQRDSLSRPDRLGVVVRPNFVRPAHFERSIGFGSSGYPGSDQYQDTMRVRENIARLTNGALAQPFDLSSFMDAVARQLGTARAWRLSQGRLLSSNIGLYGEMVDFGSFRAVANWRRAHGEVGEAFGDDGQHINNLAASLTFYLRKYADDRILVPDTAALVETAKKRTEEVFLESSLRAIGLPLGPESADISQAILKYYSEQQREAVKVDHPPDLRLPWIYDNFVRTGPKSGRARRRPGAPEQGLLAALERVGGGSRCNAERFFRPRPLLNFKVSNERARRLCERLTDDDGTSHARVSAFIQADIARSRRHWPGLDFNLDIHAHAVTPSTAAVFGVNLTNAEAEMRARIYIADGRAVVFDQAYPWDQLDHFAEPVAGNAVILRIPLAKMSLSNQTIGLRGKPLLGVMSLFWSRCSDKSLLNCFAAS